MIDQHFTMRRLADAINAPDDVDPPPVVEWTPRAFARRTAFLVDPLLADRNRMVFA